MSENLDSVRVEVKLPDYCWGSVEQGEQYGSIVISAADYILEEIPLVADRNLRKGNVLISLADLILTRYRHTIKHN